MNLSSKSELNGLGGILEELCADTAHRGWSSQVELDEAKNKVLQLALSCLPKRVPLEDALSYDIVNQIYGQNAAIDTIEAQIKLKFGGK